MKKYMDPRPIFVVALLFTIMLVAKAEASWEGSMVKVTPNSFICERMNDAQTFRNVIKAKDKNSIAAYIRQGRCEFPKATYYMTVVVDASVYTEPSMVGLMYEGKSYWTFIDLVQCCFRQ